MAEAHPRGMRTHPRLSTRMARSVWDKPLRWVHPTVFQTKRVLQQLAGAGRLALYVDVHGHSNKEDCFFYGCAP